MWGKLATFELILENLIMIAEKQLEQIRLKALHDFHINRPYGIRIDVKKKTVVLFNKEFNSLGNAETGNIEKLPVEACKYINDISYSLAEDIREKGDKVDLFFYNEKTIPYSGSAINEELLLRYNRRMFTLSGILGRKL